MPAIASCASGRHHPPVLSASSANVIEPPGVGCVVSVYRPGIAPLPPTTSKPLPVEPVDPLGFGLLPPLLLLPHAANNITATSARAMTAAPLLRVLRDPKPCLTCSPQSHLWTGPDDRQSALTSNVTAVTVDRTDET